MMARKVLYKPGDWFAVPLRSDGYALGIVSHVGSGGVLFGYFFGPKLDSLPTQVPTNIKPEDRIYWSKFGHLGLTKGKWPIIENSQEYDSNNWPMPPMIRVDDSLGVAFLSSYDDLTLKCIAEEKCDPKLIDKYPYDGLMGAGAVEIRLTNILGES